MLKDIKTWLFIATNETDQLQVLSFFRKCEVLSSFNQSFANYYSTKNEQFYDLPLNLAKALKKVRLDFL